MKASRFFAEVFFLETTYHKRHFMDRKFFDWLRLKIYDSDFNKFFFCQKSMVFSSAKVITTDRSHCQYLHKMIELLNQINSISQ